MLILASASPRRKEILEKLGFDFVCKTSTVDETYPADMPISSIAGHLALLKAKDVLHQNSDAVVIGSDTIVVLNGRVLGKPFNKDDAKQMLKALSDNTHTVYTGVCVISKEQTELFTVPTKVTFGALTDEEIEWYISTGEPMDKAGAYGIQGLGCRFIKAIDGDYYSVMGLPAYKLYKVLKNFNLEGNICSQEI